MSATYKLSVCFSLVALFAEAAVVEDSVKSLPNRVAGAFDPKRKTHNTKLSCGVSAT